MKTENKIRGDWVNLWEAPAPLFLVEVYAKAFTSTSLYKSLYGCFPNYLLYPLRNGSVTAYHTGEEIKQSPAIGLKAHSAKSVIAHIVAQATKNNRQMRAYGKNLVGRNLKQSSSKQLARILNEFFSYSLCSTSHYKCFNDEFQTDAGKVIENFLVSKGVDSTTAHDYVYEVCMPTEATTLDTYELEVNSLAQSICKKSKEKKLIKRAAAISEQYGWIGTGEGGHYWGPDFILNEARKQAREGLAKLKSRALKKKQTYSQQKKKVAKIMRSFGVPGSIKKIAKQIAQLGHVKFEARISWACRDRGFANVLKTIADRYNVPLSDLNFYFHNEFLELLKNNQRVLSSTINERRQLSLFIVNRGEYFFYSGEEAQKILARELSESDFSLINSVQGLIAQKGKVSGRVVVVSPLEDQRKELAKVCEGDILVTGMTRPHMLIAMRHASAFVTDEGGITCHAAIVAREMKKPCIIATKIATKVFKDGDMVEVDANTGIVRIIEPDKD